MASFPTTRRSVVLSLASSDAEERSRAFDTLVALYWRPLYKYARIAWGRSQEDCEDLTQSFFANLLSNEALASYDPARASFRTFLRMLFERSMATDARAQSRQKRGGGQTRLDFHAAEAEVALEKAAGLSPEEMYQQDWIRSVFTLAVERLRETVPAKHFALFEAYDLEDGRALTYRSLSEQLSIPETSVTNYLSATRRQFREIVLETLREATASEQEFRSEARALLGVER